MKVALFSDVHGRLRIMLRMVQCWQIAHETHLDAVLLAGDIGCFPDESRFDKATRRWIERDPEEAGFPKYFMRPKADVQTVFRHPHELGPFADVRCPILFVAGNHEDHQYLETCRKKGHVPGMPAHTFPVDCYKRILCIENGYVVTLKVGNGSLLRIAGLWGVENSRPRSPVRISQEAAERLIAAGKDSFDVLLTHDVPHHSYTGHAGSETISSVLSVCKPPLHVFGHAHPVDGRHEFFADPIPTRSWIFEDCGFGKDGSGSLNGAMGILKWPGDNHGRTSGKIELVQDEWLTRMRQRTWKHVWP